MVWKSLAHDVWEHSKSRVEMYNEKLEKSGPTSVIILHMSKLIMIFIDPSLDKTCVSAISDASECSLTGALVQAGAARGKTLDKL